MSDILNKLLKAPPAHQIAGMLLIFLFVFSILPPGAQWIESSMARHMLVQIPLLILLGAIAYKPTSRINNFLKRTDPLGIISFIWFSGWMLFWMLPLNLDLATFDPLVRLLKLVSVPIIGISLRALWHRANAILKCVVIFEVWASVTRLGWLYVESPQQLCSSYLIGEQNQVGVVLLVISSISACFITFFSLFGSFGENSNRKLPKSPVSG